MVQSSDTCKYKSNILAARIEKKDIPFNYKLHCVDDCEIVVITDNIARRLRNLDEGIINPKRQMLITGKLRKKTDNRTHIIYLIRKVYDDAKWGGNIQYNDPKSNDTQEKIFIRARYTFKIERGDKFISLLSETKEQYDQRYVVVKINSKIDNVVKSYISQNLRSNGFIKAQENMPECTDKIRNKLNEDVLFVFGIRVINLNISLEEDEDDPSKRRSEPKQDNLEKEDKCNDQFIYEKQNEEGKESSD